MKKVLSILLLLVFLFNVGGYYLLFWGLRHQRDKELSDKLDTNGYNPEQTFKLRIPVTLPYPLQSTGYERIDGMFEHNGEYFKLVKHKLQGDTLYVICIRDEATRELVNVMADYMQLTQTLPNDAGQKALHFLSKLIKDFYTRPSTDIRQPTGRHITVHYIPSPDDLLQRAIPVPAPPPKI